MKAVVSEKGQITIPKAVRDKLGLRGGTVLEVSAVNGQIVARKQDYADPLVRWKGKGKLPVGASVDEYLRIVRG